ncbi:MAG: bifunctional phosphopantothenoylcysteine decarboxylase/phosphopantothenate--cysteine ligase CoaBC [Candidatus Marinimicrobia bacterium]|nr:bifunctional phosphopantothenoylcysteine decarboxylase/phosphopantothenate--cysteine ligase CoaBC [Candidatus Neomarinimicrobiota bacterium]
MKKLKNKNILIGITGSIAAYKACDIIRIIRKAGGNVQAIMTHSAKQFIGKSTIAALTNNPVIDSIFEDDPKPGLEHINLAFDIDMVLILPATANIIAKAANGIADDSLSLALSICEQPTIFCPAMNYKMWRNKANLDAVEKLRKRGKIIVDPEDGFLASLHEGKGRLANTQRILNNIQSVFDIKLPLKNKNIVITAGPTQEPIDGVRYISNRSSGKMGFAIAETAHNLGANVTLIAGPNNLKDIPGITMIHINTASDMLEAVSEKLDSDYIVMNAAVADYRPKNINPSKIKKHEAKLNIELEPTVDILDYIKDKTKACIIGFALEMENLEENALDKMNRKKLDFIVLNTANNINQGFDVDTNQVTIFSSSGKKIKSDIDTKERIARFMWNEIID